MTTSSEIEKDARFVSIRQKGDCCVNEPRRLQGFIDDLTHLGFEPN